MPTLDPLFLAAFRAGTLSPEQANDFATRDDADVALLLIQLSLAIAGLATATRSGPHTPPSTVPTFLKPPTSGGTRKVGAKPGHTGQARAVPETIDAYVDHTLSVCPCCQGELQRTGQVRTRIIEDIPADLKAHATEHTINRDYCPNCQKIVEPIVPDALPGCTLGHRVNVLSAWLHYGLGTTTSQVVDIWNQHLQLPMTQGGLTESWHRLAEILTPWYEQIRDNCLNAEVLHADETGWRTAGRSGWLWCATATGSTYYWIDDNRGHAALNEFFVTEFAGILVTDFWRAYNAYAPQQQKCWAHLLRDLKTLDETPDATAAWLAFSQSLKKIYGDGVRGILDRDQFDQATFDEHVLRLHERWQSLMTPPSVDGTVRKMQKRLDGTSGELLLFAEFAHVPATNNQAEREIRPAVLMRKASYGSMSDRGSRTRSILMSVYRTLKQRGLDPLETTTQALRTYTTTSTLPELPRPSG